MKERIWLGCDLEVLETPEGLLIRQGNKQYIAKRWRLSSDVCFAIETALDNGFTALIRRNNPLDKNLLPNGQGVEHIGFSRAPDEHWWFVLNERSAADPKHRDEIKRFTVSDRLRHALAQAAIPFKEEPRNKHAPEVPFSELKRVVTVLSQSTQDMKK